MNYELIKKNFEAKGYAVSCFDDKRSAVEYLKKELAGKTVGFGGSQTLTRLDLRHALAESSVLFVPDFPEAGESFRSTAKKAMDAEAFLLSVNGATINGEIVNIDGFGNRLAASLFGHRKVYYLISENKLCDSPEQAIYRARNIAGPKNALRLHCKTPCAMAVRQRLLAEFAQKHADEAFDQLKWQEFIEELSDEELGTHCYDCKSPERICSSLLIHWQKPSSMDAEIILLGGHGGF